MLGSSFLNKEIYLTGKKAGRDTLVATFKRPWDSTIEDTMVIKVTVDPDQFVVPKTAVV